MPCPRGEMDITAAFEAVGGGSIPSEGTQVKTTRISPRAIRMNSAKSVWFLLAALLKESNRGKGSGKP